VTLCENAAGALYIVNKMCVGGRRNVANMNHIVNHVVLHISNIHNVYANSQNVSVNQMLKAKAECDRSMRRQTMHATGWRVETTDTAAFKSKVKCRLILNDKRIQ